MRKFILFGLMLAMLVAAVAFATDAAEKAPIVPLKVTIEKCGTTKTPVTFDHKAHGALAKTCTVCHHTSEGLTLEKAATMKVPACASCHAKPEKAETPVCSDKTMTANPYHMLCVGCHKETKLTKADTKAPSMCTGCHVKAAS